MRLKRNAGWEHNQSTPATDERKRRGSNAVDFSTLNYLHYQNSLSSFLIVILILFAKGRFTVNGFGARQDMRSDWIDALTTVGFVKG